MTQDPVFVVRQGHGALPFPSTLRGVAQNAGVAIVEILLVDEHRQHGITTRDHISRRDDRAGEIGWRSLEGEAKERKSSRVFDRQANGRQNEQTQKNGHKATKA